MRGKANWIQIQPELGGFTAFLVYKGGTPGVGGGMGNVASRLPAAPRTNPTPYQNNGQYYVVPKGTAPPTSAAPTGGQQTGGGFDLQSLIGQITGQHNTANAANESRYQQILGLADADKGERQNALTSVYDQLRGLAMGQSDAALQREGRVRDHELGQVQQSAVSRGLNNTTIKDSLRRGVVDDSALRVNEIHDARANKMMGITANYGDRLQDILGQTNLNKMGVMERRTDEGPDLGLLAQLLMQPGAMGGGTGAGAGTGGGGYGGNLGGMDWATGRPMANGTGFDLQSTLRAAANGMPTRTMIQQVPYGAPLPIASRGPLAQQGGTITGRFAPAVGAAMSGFEAQAPNYGRSTGGSTGYASGGLMGNRSPSLTAPELWRTGAITPTTPQRTATASASSDFLNSFLPSWLRA